MGMWSITLFDQRFGRASKVNQFDDYCFRHGVSPVGGTHPGLACGRKGPRGFSFPIQLLKLGKCGPEGVSCPFYDQCFTWPGTV
eukprot:2193719-Karenia_brevis.AAC.1